MRLLTTSNPKVVNFTSEQEIPPYAILSHVWDDAEVSFQQMQNLSSIKPDQKGYIKIVRACELARSDDYEYLWIDTCCIDKTSSAELAEAINSMYEYYRKAEVCYAYLADVPPGPSFETAFRDSKWFTRGWTLQELLAPRAVTFLANDWNDIGTKATLREIITVITGIPSRILLMNVPVTEISVAQRMSWAARRKTTRVEDRAYSLMGLFGVFLPTIYGEGKHAFTTLQEEILKVSDNQTIFAWTSDDRFGGLLAASPDNFKDSGEYEPTTPRTDYQRLPYSITNIGLQIHLPLRP
ncbi:heterokaryon incompatibility protein-domain-containing protein, partial [Rhodocollybia butyracea]